MTSVGWAGRKPRVAVLGARGRTDVTRHADRLRELIEPLADFVVWDFEFQRDLVSDKCDFVVTLGGDGTILRTARLMGADQLPVLGVNLGKLGFLAAHSPDEIGHVLASVCAGRCRIAFHLMLQCTVLRRGSVLATRLGLNETALLGGAPYSMRDIELYVDAELATTYSCDGLIVSTPVGSTAHSLSAGGPILRKDLQAFVIAPLSPHTLTVRPVVDTADRVLEMVVRKPDSGTSVVVDGQVLCQITPDERVRVERARPEFQMIEVAGQNYYRTLREKLGWGGHIQNARRAGDAP